MFSKSSAFVVIFSALVSGAQNHQSTSSIFTIPGLSIGEAPAENILKFHELPYTNHLVKRLLNRHASIGNGRNLVRKRQSSNQTINTVFSGVYPVVNVTWGNKDGTTSQSFISFIDTGSSDTWAIADNFLCTDLNTNLPAPQSACGFGPLYNTKLGKFTNITDQKFDIGYYPEMETMHGSMVYAPITLGGLTVPKQEVALAEDTTWSGDTFSSGLLGMGYASATGASSRKNSTSIKYDPIFTTMVKQGIVKEAVFTIATNRVPRGTPPSTPAGVMALGGLVPSTYYDAPFTSVPIESLTGSRGLSLYATTHELLYGLKNGTVISGGTYQSIVDSGTSPNMIPTASAKHLNQQFVPPAVYNSTLRYWVVDCNATAPYAAFKVGGKVMPMDPRDMIVRSLNGLVGYENTCFSAFGDGGDVNQTVMIIGSVWQRSYVVAYDQGRSMLHFATRKPY